MSFQLKSLFSMAVLVASFNSSIALADNLSFFGGSLKAKTTWVTVPSSVKSKAELKIELFDSQDKRFDLDPSLIAYEIFMPAMPGMGFDQQNVVNMNDASGSPIAGVYLVSDITFSMGGGWAANLKITSPTDQSKNEKQKLPIGNIAD
jgi:hypothetical protein